MAEHKEHVEKQEAQEQKSGRFVLALAAFLIVVVGGGIAGTAYILASRTYVSIDKSAVEASSVDLAPTATGDLRAVYVHEGDTIQANTVVAQVGVELIKSNHGGLIIMARTDIGAHVSAGETIVSVIDPSDLRVVGQLEEDKGLKDLKVGDRASFTVDAFGSTKFDGVVAEIAPTSNTGDVVFSISDKRQVQSFDVKVRFDETAHPELKNGMSAKLRVYKTP